MVAVVRDNLAAGLSPDDVLRSYPTLTLDDLLASLQYAAEPARERTVH